MYEYRVLIRYTRADSTQGSRVIYLENEKKLKTTADRLKLASDIKNQERFVECTIEHDELIRKIPFWERLLKKYAA